MCGVAAQGFKFEWKIFRSFILSGPELSLDSLREYIYIATCALGIVELIIAIYGLKIMSILSYIERMHYWVAVVHLFHYNEITTTNRSVNVGITLMLPLEFFFFINRLSLLSERMTFDQNSTPTQYVWTNLDDVPHEWYYEQGAIMTIVLPQNLQS